MNITTSPNVSNFDFTACLDLTENTAVAHMVDISTYISGGQANIIGINFKIVDPNNLTFHESIYPPDIDLTPGLTDFDVNLPTFNGAVKWGIYKIFATLIDEDGTQYEWIESGLNYKAIRICKPNTLVGATKNFGGLDILADFNCNTGVLLVEDGTAFTYNGYVPDTTETTVTVTYPVDPTGTPSYQTATFMPFTLPISLSGLYSITAQVIQTYQYTPTTCVNVAYKFQKAYDIQCGYTLCKARCDFDRLFKEVKDCTSVSPAETAAKQKQLILITALLSKAESFSNCSGADISGILDEIREIGDFDCDCDCTPAAITPSPIYFNGTIVKGNMCGDIDMTITQFGTNVKIDLSDVTTSIKLSDATAEFATIGTVTNNCSKQYILDINPTSLVEAASVTLEWLSLDDYLEAGFTGVDAEYAIDIFGNVYLRGKITHDSITSGTTAWATGLPFLSDYTGDQKFGGGGLDTQAITNNPYILSYLGTGSLLISVLDDQADFQFYLTSNFNIR